MSNEARKVILFSKNGYSEEYDTLLNRLISEKILLFCAVGKDCELWHDIMDELIVGDGTTELDFDMITTWHENETLDEVIQFAEDFDIGVAENNKLKIIEV